MNDPKELFVISAITREDIATELNESLSEDREDWSEVETGETILPTDPRLTREFCQEYADGLKCCHEDAKDEDTEATFVHEHAMRMREQLLSGSIADAI